jgi:ferredoxin
VAYVIDLAPCINCGLCRFSCPTDTIKYFSTGHRTHVVDPEGCIDCDICAQICPMGCISHSRELRPAAGALEQAKELARERVRSTRAAVRELDDQIRPFVGATSPVISLQPEYVPDSNNGGGP